MMDIIFSIAQIQDSEQISVLVNSAYRGEFSKQGWTTEADFLEGRRTDRGDVLNLIGHEHSMIWLCKAGEKLLGSVHLQHIGDSVEIGMLAVSPPHQGLGIGKRLLQCAESSARETWEVKRFVMAVIPHRLELIAFYQRRGYRCTGKSKPFPDNPVLWTPKVEGLRLAFLEKTL